MDPDVARPGANKIPSRRPSVVAAVGTLQRQAEQAHRNNTPTIPAPNYGAFVPPGDAVILTAVGAGGGTANVRISAPGRGADFVQALISWGTAGYFDPGGSVTEQALTINFGAGGIAAQLADPASGVSAFAALVQLNTDFTVGATFDTSPTSGGTINVNLTLLGVSALLPNVRLTS